MTNYLLLYHNNSKGKLPKHRQNLYYILTREAYIRQVCDDWSKGKKLQKTRKARKQQYCSEVSNAKEILCQKYNIKNTGFNTYMTTFKKDYCYLCNKNTKEGRQKRKRGDTKEGRHEGRQKKN